jgi:hypothetical protein
MAIWKNGDMQTLGPDHPRVETYARSVFALNGDVYVAGDELLVGAPGGSRPVLWINGEAHRLAADGWEGVARSVFVAERRAAPKTGR